MISVIIPVFNEEHNIKELLPLLDQLATGFKVEIILSTGKCICNYATYIEKSSIARIESNKRKGRAYQMNYGAFKSQGSILVFLHADVRPPKDFLKILEMS